MRSGTKPSARLALTLALTVGLAGATQARAEPSVGGSHLPLLGALILAGTGFAAWLPFGARKFLGVQAASWKLWLASALLAALFLVFAGPLILALGSMLLTGRTM